MEHHSNSIKRNVFTSAIDQILEFINNKKIIKKKLCFDTRVSTLAFRWQYVLFYVFVIKETKSGIFLLTKQKNVRRWPRGR